MSVAFVLGILRLNLLLVDPIKVLNSNESPCNYSQFQGLNLLTPSNPTIQTFSNKPNLKFNLEKVNRDNQCLLNLIQKTSPNLTINTI